MSSPICSQLDYIWFTLVLSLTIGTAGLGAGLTVSWLLRQSNPVRLKWFWRALWTQIIVFTAAGVGGMLWHNAPACFEEAFDRGGAIAAPVTRVLALLWVAGVASLVMVDLIRLVILARRRREWTALSSPVVDRVQARMGFRRRLAVFTTEEHTSPFVLGWWRPQLILPHALLQRLSPAQLEAVVAHELVHLRDYDSLWSIPELLVRRLLFFHPATFFAKHAYYDIQEKAADLGAIRGLQLQPREYSESFLEVISWVNQRPRRYANVAAVSTLQKLKERLEFIARGPSGENHWLARGLVTLSLLFSGAWCVAQARTFSLDPALTGGMCVQIEHEEFLEKILHLKPEPKTCEKAEK